MSAGASPQTPLGKFTLYSAPPDLAGFQEAAYGRRGIEGRGELWERKEREGGEGGMGKGGKRGMLGEIAPWLLAPSHTPFLQPSQDLLISAFFPLLSPNKSSSPVV